MIIAIDTGNRSIKTAHADPFSAGLNSHGKNPPPVAVDTLFYKDEYFTFAENQGSYRYDKTEDEHYYILSLAAMAREILMLKALSAVATNKEAVDFKQVMRKAIKDYNGITIKENVSLAVGLPPTHLGGLRERYKDYFFSGGNVIEFAYNGINFEVTLEDVFIFAQGFAAVTPKNIFDEVRKESQAFVIDIGGYTTDVILITNGVIDLTFYQSFDMGVIHMYNEIARKVAEVCQISNLTGVIIEGILNGKSPIGAEGVKEVVEETAALYAKELVRKLKDNRVDFKLSRPVLLGGGSYLLKPYLTEAINHPNIMFLPDVRANAKGYELCAKRAVNQKKV